MNKITVLSEYKVKTLRALAIRELLKECDAKFKKEGKDKK